MSNDLLNIGSSALAAYKVALGAVGDNVANAQTEGYSRRSVRTKEIQGNFAAVDIGSRKTAFFNGVVVAEVVRAWDDFLAADARTASADAGRSAVRQQWLTSVETALDDGPIGAGSSMTTFFNTATTLASNPGDNLGRQSFLTALSDVTSAFRRTGDAMARVSDGLQHTAQLEVAGVNDTLKQIDKINTSLLTAAPGGSARASLLDQRDGLIDSLSSKMDIEVSFSDKGEAIINLASDSSVSLLRPGAAATVSLAFATDGRIALTYINHGAEAPLPVAGGKFAGLVSTANEVAGRRSELDAIANQFIGGVNSWSANGRDANGNAGVPLLSGTSASTMQALVTDTDLVPAASATGVENGNLMALDSLRGAGNAEERWAKLVQGNAQVLGTARNEATATAARMDGSLAALDEVTGVDLDKEAADLLRYQQAYNAAAKIIQVSRETIDAILQVI
mgnify:CR=1 FL=1